MAANDTHNMGFTFFNLLVCLLERRSSLVRLRDKVRAMEFCCSSTRIDGGLALPATRWTLEMVKVLGESFVTKKLTIAFSISPRELD